MISAIIIDDEQHCIDRLSGLLAMHCAQTIRLAGSYQTLEDGLAGIKKWQPNLVFLDVQLKEKTGFDLLKQFKEPAFSVIFTTAYEKYAVQAFRFSALDYLLKPVDAGDLRQAVQKLEEKISKEELSRKMDALFHNLKNIRGISKKISVPTVSGLTFLEVNDIIRCESTINYTTLYLKEGKKMTVARTLKEFEELLGEYHFFRVHQSHLINLHYIKSYNRGKGGRVSMSDNTEIEVSTRRKDDFMKRLSEL